MTSDRLPVFEQHRAMLHNLAYRMVGSATEAEDLVQDTWLKWSAVDEVVRVPAAWLRKSLTRLCLDHLKSARVQREVYTGPWLPEPVPTADPAWMTDPAELAQTLSHAMLHLMERLAPAERAAYLLHEVFQYDYAEIADILEDTPAACRQRVHRARERLGRERPRFARHSGDEQPLMQAFSGAVTSGDMDGLLRLFHHDIVFYSDGGGKVSAALRPVYGADRVGRLLLGYARKWGDLALTLEPVNGTWGIVARAAGNPAFVLTGDWRDGRLTSVRAVRNPDKLARFVAPIA